MVALTYMTIADSARTTQLLQAALNVINTTLAGHRHRKNGFKDWDCHVNRGVSNMYLEEDLVGKK